MWPTASKNGLFSNFGLKVALKCILSSKWEKYFIFLRELLLFFYTTHNDSNDVFTCLNQDATRNVKVFTMQ